MNAEDFQIKVETKFDTSLIERDFSEIYQQQEANLNEFDKNTDFIFVENDNYCHIAYAWFQFQITLEKDGGDIEDDIRDIIIMVNNDDRRLWDWSQQVFWSNLYYQTHFNE